MIGGSAGLKARDLHVFVLAEADPSKEDVHLRGAAAACRVRQGV